MDLINKLEKKFGHLSVPHLIQYILIISIVGNVLNIIQPQLYHTFLSFDPYKIMHGQVWRLFTFLMHPTVSMGDSFLVDLVWYIVWLSLYYFVGTSLEQMWGRFRFNLYYVSGIIFIWIVGFVGYFVYYMQFGPAGAAGIGSFIGGFISTEYLNQSLFLAFAAMFPDVQFLVYFIIPVKAKWLGLIDLVYLGYQLVMSLKIGFYLVAALIIVSLINCGIYFLFGRGHTASPRAAYKRTKRRREYKKRAAGPQGGNGAIHRCAICGRTELDSPDLEFRYCSKCEGNYEYCSEHLFTHEHVHKNS